MGTTYKDAGVDIDAGDALVDRIRPLAARTMRPEVLSGVGGFGGLFALPPGRWREPVLVAGTDGVGTKLKVAFAAGRHRTIGIDLVAMSVNDVLTSGAEPLFFLDYYATSHLEVDQAAEVVAGVAEGCLQAGCTLLGGETAELPGLYRHREYDLAGFCVGVVEREHMLTPERVRPGDALIGLGSSGLHSNGYSLARRVLLEDCRLDLDARPDGLARPLVDELLEPTRIYVRDVLALAGAVDLHGLAHVTGSGIPGNLPRVLPPGTRGVLEAARWPCPPIFDLIARLGGVDRGEMFRTFNMGLGMVCVIPEGSVPPALALLRGRGVPAWEVGRVEAGSAEPTALVR
ncbi:MAG TPA: phosphoribosylformylglycinamidine cyclo-ligase [Myxococcaceae bacterium]|nr:phosphoribosylformylglycinamidine cyclo-ligase [Myxococcaceae bacterium]